MNRTHGMAGTPLYGVWTGMRTRCTNPAAPDFDHYGGRGIVVCDRWAEFEAFAEDMGPTYRAGLEIGRLDNDGPYAPGNCEWQTHQANMQNTRATRWLETPAGRMSLAAAARHYALTEAALRQRLAAGWAVDVACETPMVSKAEACRRGRARMASDPAMQARRSESTRKGWASRKAQGN